MAGDTLAFNDAGASLVRGAANRQRRRPASLESAFDSGGGHAGQRYPLRKGACNAIGGDQSISPAISGLLYTRRPSNVGRGVIAVVIDPIKRVGLQRSIPNIGAESLEGLVPFCADADSSSAVVGKRRVIRVCAALQDLRPSAIEISAGVAMRPTSAADRLALQTSTAVCRPTAAQRVRRQDHRAAAIASAKPCRPTVAARIQRHNAQSSSARANHVAKYTHKPVYPALTRESNER